jgi:hypothetical protein
MFVSGLQSRQSLKCAVLIVCSFLLLNSLLTSVAVRHYFVAVLTVQQHINMRWHLMKLELFAGVKMDHINLVVLIAVGSTLSDCKSPHDGSHYVVALLVQRSP